MNGQKQHDSSTTQDRDMAIFTEKEQADLEPSNQKRKKNATYRFLCYEWRCM